MLMTIISNVIAIGVGMTLVGLLQMRRGTAASNRMHEAADHFDAANNAHDDFLAKVRESALDTLAKLRQATYVAEMQAGLPAPQRIDRTVPAELRSMPTLRPSTPAQRAKVRRRARR